MITKTRTTESLRTDVWNLLVSYSSLPITAKEIATVLGERCEVVEAILLSLDAESHITLDQISEEIVVSAVNCPAEDCLIPSSSADLLLRADAFMSAAERVHRRFKRLIWWAPLVGVVLGSTLGATMLRHDKPLASLCAGIFGGIIGYFIKDTCGPRTIQDWIK